jgi:hypothetical protein
MSFRGITINIKTGEGSDLYLRQKPLAQGTDRLQKTEIASGAVTCNFPSWRSATRCSLRKRIRREYEGLSLARLLRTDPNTPTYS